MKIYTNDTYKIIDITLRLWNNQKHDWESPADQFAEFETSLPKTKRDDAASEMSRRKFNELYDWWDREVDRFNDREASFFTGDEEPETDEEKAAAFGEHDELEWILDVESVQDVPFEIFQVGDWGGRRDGETVAYCMRKTEAQDMANLLTNQYEDQIQEECPAWGGFSILDPNGELVEY